MVETQTHLYFRVEKAEKFAVCPLCGSKSEKIHDRRKQPIKDLAVRGKQVILALVKRRYRCSHCNKVFAETYQSINRYQRMTLRLITHITK